MNKFLSMMGLCLKAGRLSMGHDAVLDSVRKKQAQTVLLTTDASERHKRELTAVQPELPLLFISLSSDEIAPYLGKRCCIFSVNDAGFANAIRKKYHEEEPTNGIEV